MKLGGIVVVTYVKVIFKFGDDQINISYRKALLKNISIPNKFDGHIKHSKIKRSCFYRNGEISSRKLMVFF